MSRKASILFYWLVSFCFYMIAACTVTSPVTKSESTQKLISPEVKSSETELLAGARALKKAQPELFEKAGGVLVTNALPDGQGAMAGLRPGDILLRYDDRLLNTVKQLIRLTGEYHTETKIVLVYLLGQARETVEIHGGTIGVVVRDVDQTPVENNDEVRSTGY